MTENTCIALSAVFPLVALTVTMQKRDMHMKIRRLWIMRKLSLWSSMAAVFGLGFAVVGVELHGLDVIASFVVWVCAVVCGAGLALTLMALLATLENEEDVGR